MSNTLSRHLSIARGIKTILSSASLLGSNMVDFRYDILERGQEAVAVISWMTIASVPATMGGNRDRGTTFVSKLFFRETANASAMFDRMFSTADDVVRSLEANPTLEGTIDTLYEEVGSIRAEHSPGEVVAVGTATYLPVDVMIEVLGLE